jgi:hypothetical protein
MAKVKKCFCICCHKKVSSKAKRKQKDLEGILWSVYVCKICGHEFCERSDGSEGGRIEPKDLKKKKGPMDSIGGGSFIK